MLYNQRCFVSQNIRTRSIFVNIASIQPERFVLLEDTIYCQIRKRFFYCSKELHIKIDHKSG